jgi:hypothetical protein
LPSRLLHDPRVPRRRDDARALPVSSRTASCSFTGCCTTRGCRARRKLLLVALIAYLALPFDLVPNFNHDTMMHTENSELLADRLPNSHLRIYPDANHGFLNQYPELFGDHVGAFLSAL